MKDLKSVLTFSLIGFLLVFLFFGFALANGGESKIVLSKSKIANEKSNNNGLGNVIPVWNQSGNNVSLNLLSSNVGIGIINPARTLTIHAANPYLQIVNSVSGISSTDGGVITLGNNGNFVIHNNEDGSLVLGAGTSPNNGGIAVNNNGNVAIFKTSVNMANAKLDVFGPMAQSAVGTETISQITRLFNNIESVYPQVVSFNIGRYAVGGFAPNTRFDIKLKNSSNMNAVADINIMTLQSNGFVGIGTSSPTSTLDINGFIRLRPLVSAPACESDEEEGAIYYDSVLKKHLGCNGSSWNALY